MTNQFVNAWLIESKTNYAHQLIAGDTLIGRAPGNTIVLLDQSVSRRHALVRYQKGSFLLIPQEAQVPLKLNDYLVDSPQTLQNNDKIVIGGTVFRFVIGVR